MINNAPGWEMMLAMTLKKGENLEIDVNDSVVEITPKDDLYIVELKVGPLNFKTRTYKNPMKAVDYAYKILSEIEEYKHVYTEAYKQEQVPFDLNMFTEEFKTELQKEMVIDTPDF